MFLCLPEWGDGSKLGVPPLNALQTVEIRLFNGTLSQQVTVVLFSAFQYSAMYQLAFTFSHS